MKLADETLGSRLRAARLGYGWLQGVGLYLRVSDAMGLGDRFLFEVAPADALPKTGAKSLHRRWWAKRGSDDPPSMAPELDAVVRRTLAPSSDGPLALRAPVAFLMDGAGEGSFVRWETVR